MENTAYILSPYFRLGTNEQMLVVSSASLESIIENRDAQALILQIAYEYRHPRTDAEVIATIALANGHDQEAVTACIHWFHKKRYLMKANTYQRTTRYSRHALFYNLSGADPESVQLRLGRSHVAIVGCGGIGNLVSVNLATAGVGKLTLSDCDTIELSNLTRQILFTEADVGKMKTTTLCAALQRRASNITISTVNEKVTEKTLDSCAFVDVDLLVISADSPGLVLQLNDICVRRRVPFINVGYVEDIAVWGPFVIPGITGCCACRPLVYQKTIADAELAMRMRVINSWYQAPSIGPINMMAAAMASLDILKYLGGFGQIHTENTRIGLWTHDLHLERKPCMRNPDCVVCSDVVTREARAL